jgi:hypothetical protein
MKVNMVGVFVFKYENRKLKPIEIVLRRGRENDRGGESKIHCKHIYKYCQVNKRKNQTLDSSSGDDKKKKTEKTDTVKKVK